MLQKVSRQELTFSFDLGHERFLVTERWGSRFSTRLGTPLVSALGAFVPGLGRRVRGGFRGAHVRCPVHPSLGVPAPPLPSPASRRSAEGRRGQGLAEGLPQAPNGMNGDWTGGPGSRSRPLGVALRTRDRRAPGAKVGRDKLRDGEGSCRGPAVEDGEGSRTG